MLLRSGSRKRGVLDQALCFRQLLLCVYLIGSCCRMRRSGCGYWSSSRRLVRPTTLRRGFVLRGVLVEGGWRERLARLLNAMKFCGRGLWRWKAARSRRYILRVGLRLSRRICLGLERIGKEW